MVESPRIASDGISQAPGSSLSGGPHLLDSQPAAIKQASLIFVGRLKVFLRRMKRQKLRKNVREKKAEAYKTEVRQAEAAGAEDIFRFCLHGKKAV